MKTSATAWLGMLIAGALLLSGCAPEPTPSPTKSVTKSATPTPTPTPTNDLDSPGSFTVVVNKHRPLNPLDFEAADMTVPVVVGNPYSRPLRSEASAALDSMATAVNAAGMWITIASAYRSYDTQVSVFNDFVSRDGQAIAETYSARPGYSEHQTGLAVDLDDGSGCLVEICFADTPAGQWLAANSWQFGFVLRYPNGFDSVTGYQFEPWHFRYVGTEVAVAMHNKGVATLEEFFGLEPAPTY